MMNAQQAPVHLAIHTPQIGDANRPAHGWPGGMRLSPFRNQIPGDEAYRSPEVQRNMEAIVIQFGRYLDQGIFRIDIAFYRCAFKAKGTGHPDGQFFNRIVYNYLIMPEKCRWKGDSRIPT